MKTNNMVKVLKNGQMVPNMKVTTKMERNMVMAVSHLQMVATTQVSSRITRFLASVNTYGLMARYMRAVGKKIKCMGKAS